MKGRCAINDVGADFEFSPLNSLYTKRICGKSNLCNAAVMQLVLCIIGEPKFTQHS